MINLANPNAGCGRTMSRPAYAVAITIKGIRILLGAAVAIVAVSTRCFAADAAMTYSRPSAIFPAGDVVHGKELAVPCLVCHGENAVPVDDPPFHPPKLQHQRPSSIFYALEDYKTGGRKSDIMAPMVASLSEQDMRDLSVYLAGPPTPGPGAAGRAPPSEAPASPGRTKVIELCGFCHGLTGQGVMDGTPTLGGQYPDYLNHALADYISGARSNPTMRSVVKKITSDDIEAVIDYLSAQSTLEIVR